MILDEIFEPGTHCWHSFLPRECEGPRNWHGLRSDSVLHDPPICRVDHFFLWQHALDNVAYIAKENLHIWVTFVGPR